MADHMMLLIDLGRFVSSLALLRGVVCCVRDCDVSDLGWLKTLVNPGLCFRLTAWLGSLSWQPEYMAVLRRI